MKRGFNNIIEKDGQTIMIINRQGIDFEILIDKEDIDKINQYKWHLHLRKRDMRYDVCANTYTVNSKRKYIILPRFLLDTPKGLTVDHINRNTLDNRRCNLRNVTIFVNNLNKSNNTSGCVGVTWDKARQKWKVEIKNTYVGRFDDFNEAVQARKKAEQPYHLQNNN